MIIFNRRLTLIALVAILHSAEVYSKTALLIIDVQNCFLSGGSLAVANGNDVIPVINNIRQKYANKFDVVVLSQDWHCADHVSFASQHQNGTPFSNIYLTYDKNAHLCDPESCDVVYNISQTLWPDHCVINTNSAEFSTQLVREPGDIVIRKGYNCDVDSYSAFFDNGGFSHTDLDRILKGRGIDKLVVTGLALDFCVYYTSKDGKQLGYTVYTVTDASKPVANETKALALEDMERSGINLITSDKLEEVLVTSGAFTPAYPSYQMFLTFVSLVFCFKPLQNNHVFLQL